MNLKTCRQLFKATVKSLKANSTMATLVLSGAGYVLAVVEGCRATTKAVKTIDDSKPATKKETVKLTWRYYLKTAGLVTASTVGLIVVGRDYSKQTKQVAHLAELLAISDTALKNREAAMRAALGDKKAEEVLEEEARTSVRNHPPEETRVAMSGRGDTLTKDLYSGRYWRMSVSQVRTGIAQAALDYARHGSISYNEAMDYISACALDHIGFGDDVGFDHDISGDDVFTDRIRIDSVIDPVHDEPCTTIMFLERPSPDYKQWL